MSGMLSGKRALVFGVAADTSIAWAIAQELARHGVKVTLGYQKRFLSRILQLTKDQPWIEAKLECDVSEEASTAKFFEQCSGEYDMLVHCIAFAPASALSDEVSRTTQEDFETAMSVSSYSLARILRHAEPSLKTGAAVVALTYLGADRVVPGYRIMGTAKAALQELVRELACEFGPRKQIRVNAISAGPIRTLAASGVPGFDAILDWMKASAPLRRNVSQEDVARSSIYLLSDLSSGVTGQTIYVDAGYCITGAPPHLSELVALSNGTATAAPAQAAPQVASQPAAGGAKPVLFT